MALAAVVLSCAAAATTVEAATQTASNQYLADNVFQGNYITHNSVAEYARAGQEFTGQISELTDPASASSDTSDLFEPIDLQGEGLSATIGALGGESAGQSKSKPKPLLTFWAEPNSIDLGNGEAAASAEVALAAAAAAAGNGPGNVLIPLPMAAWSALSVMGGYGVLAGIRRMRLRMHG